MGKIRQYQKAILSLEKEGYNIVNVFNHFNQIRCYLIHPRNGNRMVVTVTPLAMTFIKNGKVIKVE